MWDKLKNTDSRIYLLMGVIILAIILLQQCDARKKAEADLAMAGNNIAALTDTVTRTKNRLGEEQFEKRTFITSLKGLESLNKDLYQEVKAQKGQVAQLTKIVGVLSTPLPQEPIGGTTTSSGSPCDSLGGSFATEWESHQQFDSTNYRTLSAQTEITLKDKRVKSSQTKILKDEIGFNLITGLEKKDNGYKIFVRSNYPGFKPTKIDGAFIPQEDLFPPQKKKNWGLGIGPQIGIGLGGVVVPTPVWYLGLGISLQYNIFKF